MGAQLCGNWSSPQSSALRIDQGVHSNYFSQGGHLTSGGADAKSVPHRTGAHFRHVQNHLHLLFKSQRVFVFTLDLDPGPPGDVPALCGVHAKTKRAQEGVLGRLHPAEKVRKVDNSSHVGFGKFNPAAVNKLGGHEG